MAGEHVVELEDEQSEEGRQEEQDVEPGWSVSHTTQMVQ